MRIIEWCAMVLTFSSMALIGQNMLFLGWITAATGSVLWIVWGILRTNCTALIILNLALVFNALAAIANLGE